MVVEWPFSIIQHFQSSNPTSFQNEWNVSTAHFYVSKDQIDNSIEMCRFFFFIFTFGQKSRFVAEYFFVLFGLYGFQLGFSEF